MTDTNNFPEIGIRDATYKDSTPKLNVGNSSFEDWFQAQPFACQEGIKQMCRDSYAAGMGDPLVTYANQPELKPLSLDEIHQRYKNLRVNEPPHYIDIYRDAEAALGILRGGL